MSSAPFPLSSHFGSFAAESSGVKKPSLLSPSLSSLGLSSSLTYLGLAPSFSSLRFTPSQTPTQIDFEVENPRDSKAPNRLKDHGFGGCGHKRDGGSGGFGEYNLGFRHKLFGEYRSACCFRGSLMGMFLSEKVWQKCDYLAGKLANRDSDEKRVLDVKKIELEHRKLQRKIIFCSDFLSS